MAYRLDELVDITRLRSLLDGFSLVSGVPTSIVASDGSLLSCSGWKEICLSYHQRHPEARRCCDESNARVTDELSRTGGCVRYVCPHGFVKAAFALAVDGEHLGTMFTGQMLLSEPDQEQFRTYARRYGFDEEGYLEELRRVPVMGQERLDATLSCLSQLTGMIVDMAVAANEAYARSAEVDRLAERYCSIIDTTADGFWIVDGQGRCLEANDLCCAMHGYTREELKGMHLSDLEALESPEETAAHIAMVKSEGFGRFETRHRRKDGTAVDVEVSTAYIAGEDIFIAFLRDLTGQKRADKELQRSREFLDRIINAVSSPLFVKDRNHRIILANDADCDLIGSGREEILGRTDHDFFPKEQADIFWQRDEDVLTTGVVNINEETVRQADGRSGTIIAKKSRYTDADGNHFVVGVLTDITTLKNTEAALRESEERFRMLFRLAPVPYQSLDANGCLQEVNDAWCHMMGYEPEEVRGTWIGDYLTESYRLLLQERMSLFVQGSNLSGRGCQFLRKDGSVVDVIVEGGSSYDSQGRFTQTHCILLDVTERKRAEEALRKSEENYRSIVETTTEWIWAIDLAGNHTFSNSTLTDILGYPVDEFIGQHTSNFMHEDDWRAAESMLPRLIAEKQGWRGLVLRWRHKDGSYRYLESNATPVIIEDECVGYRGADRDVTERMRAEEELRASQQRIQFLMTATPTVIYTCRPTGDFGATFISDNVRSLMGYEPKDFLEDSAFWLEHVHVEDRARIVSGLAQLLTAGCHSHEYRFRTRDGSYRWMQDEIVLIRDAEGTPLECIGCWFDVTNRREAEEEVRRLNAQLEERVRERTAELESFCYSISHDLRAPLRAIDGFTSILREEYEPLLDELGKDLCGRISSNAVRMGSLIDDLLGFSRVGRISLDQEPLDMTGLVRSVFEELLAPQDRDRVEFRLTGLPKAMADLTTLRQVWSNLLGNALKYSSREPRAIIEVGGRREGDEIVYFVRDNGVGFDMAYVDKLFGVFLRVHSPVEFPGTGVGLAIVDRIVQRHGGRVWAEGEVGKGATFFFSLPVRAELQ